MYSIYSAGPADMGFIMGLAAGEGWNPGLCDGDSFYAADPGGFFIGELSGEKVGCISAVSYGSFGFIGLYIVREGFRHRGYGLPLWDMAVKRLQGCNIGLDGVPAQQENYKKSGFHLAHRNFRYEGLIETGVVEAPVVPAEEVRFDDLAAYDAACFPSGRRSFLSSWVRAPGSTTLVFRQGGQIRGYGAIRRCITGYKVGPLFCDSYEVADALFASLARVAGDQPVYLDISEANVPARRLCEKYHMKPKFETARMYTGRMPDISWEKVYGITTFELG